MPLPLNQIKDKMTTIAIDRKNSMTGLRAYYLELAAFNNWADNRIINWLTQITDVQWNQSAVSSFGSLRDTAVHIVSAKKLWIDTWTGVPNPAYLSAGFNGSKDDLIDIWKESSEDLTSFIENYPEENYNKPVTVKKPNGELCTMEFRKTFPHMINHATYHRGQLVTLLRQAGFSVLSNTDLFTFYNM